MHELILGGARSGKSAYAEGRAEASGLRPVYLATATAGDAEMAARIARHRERRGNAWQTVEEPLALGAALRTHAVAGRCVLVDCLTLWLTNLLLLDDAARLAAEREALFAALEAAGGPVLLVSNEVGQGIVPMDALSRRFVDAAGLLHQQLAAHCQSVTLVTAGLTLKLKGSPA